MLKKEVEKLLAAQASALQSQLKGQVEEVNGINFLAAKLPLQNANAVKTLAYNLEADLGDAGALHAAALPGRGQAERDVGRAGGDHAAEEAVVVEPHGAGGLVGGLKDHRVEPC